MPISGIVTPFVEKLVFPILESFVKSVSHDIKLNLTPIQNHFKDYFERTYNNLSVVNTIAFKNSRRKLNDIYQELTLVLNSHKAESHKISTFPKKLLCTYDRVLITDTAGMGKSTLVKKIFLETINNQAAIPLFIELRKLSKENTILTLIQEQLNAINRDFNQKLLLDLLAQGGFIILLDGYDEIKQQDKAFVTEELLTFISKTHKNKFILTSRPENSLSSFGDFQNFTIAPLKKQEAFSLLKKYDNSDEIAPLLIQRIEEEIVNMKEFLVNPLLVSLLFTAFEYKPKIPTKKHLFYSQVFDALYESHDLSKGAYEREKNCGLDIDDFKKVLRHLGYFSFKDGLGIEYTKDKLIELIELSKKESEIPFQASCFLEDLITTVPLFVRDGLSYKWAHKSLQEYFVARFINEDSDSERTKILLAMYNSKNIQNYINIFDIFYDINLKAFIHTIINELVCSYHRYMYSCKYNQDNYPHIDTNRLKCRRELTFHGKLILPLTKNEEVANIEYESLYKEESDRESTTMMGYLYDRKEFGHSIYVTNHIIYIINLLGIKNNSLVKNNNLAESDKVRKYLAELADYIINQDNELIDTSWMLTCK